MNIIFRIMLAVYAFCLTIVSLISMVFLFNPDYLTAITNYLTGTVFQNKNASITLFLIEIIFFGLSIVFLLSGFKTDSEKKAVTRHTNMGEIRISLNAIETIVLNATKKISGIKETKATISKHGDSVSIVVRSIVMADINIPSLLEDVQLKVKKSVEDMTSVKVTEINASVENVYAGYKSRVE